MRIIVIGGDGFCGWPTATHLSAHGHEVTIVDNLARRAISEELDAHSLTPIRPLGTRVQAWEETTGRTIAYHYLDAATDYDQLRALLTRLQPDAVVHFAEQRAAPYSMKSSAHKRYTVANNTAATHNLLCALVEAEVDSHLVHLGTMGVYGYTTTAAPLPEGYLTVQIPGPEGETEEREILYPANPGSIYHLTKTQDQLAFQFYNANDGLRITDLHQGIVWGTQTEETHLDGRLINRFDYDGDFGTVLNRFLMQAGVGHPLTVHGSGGQTRAFIHIRDTVRCIRLAIETPPEAAEGVRIFNQATETGRIRDLAQKVSKLTGATIDFQANPRKEAAENELRMRNEGLRTLGWEPITLDNGLMEEVRAIAERYAHRCDLSKIPAHSFWTRPKPTEEEAAADPTAVPFTHPAQAG
ncbi:NAD-dependent epimerase/dehydratase family protein [Thiohalorhabdus sp.]|uniref:NAD-dependent epimerase/dehydratase family protein n=1 Tax=Thiohalorhabdus sp. TaxID=3094134 RepID=UPI002FC361B9